MKILYITSSLYAWKSGCWFVRNRVPAVQLSKEGHEVRHLVTAGQISEEWYAYPDVVVYGRHYAGDVAVSMKEYKKRGKKVIYDLDDDLWTVNKANPAKKRLTQKQLQAIDMLKEADVVTVTTDILKKRLKKYNKNIVVIPNAHDFDMFPTRNGNNETLRIGFSGAATHWDDLTVMVDVVTELQKKYDFEFVLQGLCGSPLIAEVYECRQIKRQGAEPEKEEYINSLLRLYDKIKGLKFTHVPFHPPELHPSVISDCNLDIGLAPLQDNKFNQAKSCNKFYEYAAVGTVTLASNVLPYKKEVGYLANNTHKDWKAKLEKLIVNEKFRKDLLKKQQDFVFSNRDIKKVIKTWEKVLK